MGSGEIASLIGIVPGVVTAALALTDRLGKHAHEQHIKNSLEVIRMKYELEALRKREKLDLPAVVVSTQERQLLASEIGDDHLLHPMRLRGTFTFRYVMRNPRVGAVVTSIGALCAALYGFAAVMTSILMATSGEFRKDLGASGAEGVGMTIAYVLVGLLLLGWSVRIRNAKRLALAESAAAKEQLAEAASAAGAEKPRRGAAA